MPSHSGIIHKTCAMANCAAVGAGRRGSALVGGSVMERLAKRRDKNVRSTLVLEHFWRAWTSVSICIGRGPIISFQNPRKILNRVETFTTWPLGPRVLRAPSDSSYLMEMYQEPRSHGVPSKNPVYNIKTYKKNVLEKNVLDSARMMRHE